MTDLPERYTWLKTIYLGVDSPRPVALQGVRFHKTRVLLKLDGYDDRNAADTLRGQWLQVPEADAVPLDEDEYYLYQLIGLKVFEEDESYLGTLTEVLETKANNVFIVNGPAGEILVPDISQVIRDINFENGRLVVRLLPGLRPE
jgi:16S rRNA processing protein RimM